jgi:hypothetical protein
MKGSIAVVLLAAGCAAVQPSFSYSIEDVTVECRTFPSESPEKLVYLCDGKADALQRSGPREPGQILFYVLVENGMEKAPDGVLIHDGKGTIALKYRGEVNLGTKPSPPAYGFKIVGTMPISPATAAK